MSGVTIQNIEIINQYGWGLDVVGLILLSVAIIGTVMFIVGFVTVREGALIIGFMLMLFGVIIGVGLMSHSRLVSSYNQYEVTIDDTVNMQEFMSTYKIKEQRGGIYTVVEITEDGEIKYEYY